MKKLYFLNEEEKERILKLHESATRKQYISEDMDDSENMDNRMCEGCGKSDMYEYSELDEVDAGLVGTGIAFGGLGIIYSILNSGAAGDGVYKIFQQCKKGAVGKRTQNDSVLSGIADSINNAVEGMGTDEEAIGKAFRQINTIADLCGLATIYQTRHGEDLYGALDSDIDRNDEWKKYVYLPLLDRAVVNSKKQETSSGAGTGTATSKGSIADKYWDVLFNQLQPLGAKMANNRTFIYWGMWVIYKDMSKNGGYPITYGNPIKMSFKFSNGTYAGQPLQNITLIAKGSTTPITIQSLAKMKEAQIVAAGSGSVSAAPSAGKVSSKGSKPSGPSPVLTSDIKQIQNIVGVAQTGVFDTATKAAVKTKLGIK